MNYLDQFEWREVEDFAECGVIPGVYSIWEHRTSDRCLYVGTSKNITKRVFNPYHPWKAARHLFENPCLRYVEISDKKERLLTESLAIGTIRPEWNFNGTPELTLENKVTPQAEDNDLSTGLNLDYWTILLGEGDAQREAMKRVWDRDDNVLQKLENTFEQ